ncbi:cupin domain-containing protein [Actinotalea sp. M2MS4P-6]|uniref:cupin domain-containing protein n=1 Tax=Actinotalea sp. M2MS4P-6 TaxID=2983762 RepID=UPI0021E4D4EB|nr:cupin domain-containing protein [Actinotalea sp. M2MS4P-6]MCV2395289.1 cupin domain-containing protein [Actinotalea sp. M2MS4P-6]
MSAAEPVPRSRAIPADALRLPGSRTLKFVGREHGSGVSFFLVDNDPGQGPALHRHPYTETWSVLAGTASITLGDEVVQASAGHTVVVQPGTWHGFTNTGEDVLRMICIHASDVMIQEEWSDVAGRDEEAGA